MKSDFMLAITQLSAEKNLPREIVLKAVETALVSAYKKDNFAADQDISVKINPNTGGVQVWAEKIAVEAPADLHREISLGEARRIKPDVEIGDTIAVEATPHNAGRIAAQTAKQVILQRLHEAEHSAIFEEYADKEGDIITGMVRRIEPRQIFVDLGRTEAILPTMEQMQNERYRIGQRLRVYLLEVAKTGKGPRLIVSRSHPNLLRRLFELEVPEILNGTVKLISIAREAGYRSKVAVAACQEGIDPVGCCVGLRGIRIQNIVNELNGEKVDVIMWDPNPAVLITNALSPAQVLRVDAADGETATVVVPDNQLSLAIGKEGQNVRLAAKLAGRRIDIKSASVAEAEAKSLPAETKAALAVDEETLGEEPSTAFAEAEELATEAAEAPPATAVTLTPPATTVEPPAPVEKVQIKFAEDVKIPTPIKPVAKSKKKRKSTPAKSNAEDGIKIKKLRRIPQAKVIDEISEYDEEDQPTDTGADLRGLPPDKT